MINLVLGIVLGFFLYSIATKIHPLDPTDDLANKKRSGLLYFKDHGTGVEYLANPKGGPLMIREKQLPGGEV